MLNLEDAYRVVGWYECRWIIEEYHKGLKTGCKIESPQFTTEEIISEDYVAVLSVWRHGRVRLDWSIHDFYYAMARLGGHQNRKGDHPPGWRTIWEGWKELQAMVSGADVAKAMEKCG